MQGLERLHRDQVFGSSLYRVGSGIINPGGLRNKTAESQSAQRTTNGDDYLLRRNMLFFQVLVIR